MQPLQYVILWHRDIDEPHYDLMFETLPGSQLATWRSSIWPLDFATSLIRLKDHRRMYLTYEGDLSGHRGMVSQLAKGTCEVEIGENAVWTIKLLTGATPQRMVFRQVSAENWEGSSDMG